MKVVDPLEFVLQCLLNLVMEGDKDYTPILVEFFIESAVDSGYLLCVMAILVLLPRTSRALRGLPA